MAPVWVWLCLAHSNHCSPNPNVQIRKYLLGDSTRPLGSRHSLGQFLTKQCQGLRPIKAFLNTTQARRRLPSGISFKQTLDQISSNGHEQGPLSQKLWGCSSTPLFFSQLSQALNPKIHLQGHNSTHSEISLE